MPRSAVLLLTSALMALASPALAATQTTADGDDGVAEQGGKAVDARQVVIDQSGETTSFSVSFEQFTRNSAPADTLILFLDTNEDAKSDWFVRFQFAPTEGKYYVASASTPDSLVGCQKTTNHGEAFTEENKDLAPADANGWQTVVANVPTARIGGATTFRWALYVATDSLTRSTYDYVPDSANPRGGGSGTATGNFDGCDTNGDGTWGGDGDAMTNDGAWPVALTDGVKFPPAASQPAPGPGADNPFLPDPALAAIPAPATLKTITFPDVRPGSSKCDGLCTIESVEARLQKLGLRNYRLVLKDASYDDFPKKYKKRVEDGHVAGQSPAPGTEVGEPNVRDYPDMKLPVVKLTVWRESQLKYGCKDGGIEGVLKNMSWPGQTRGTGPQRVYGALDILEKKRCKYALRYRKSSVSEPKITAVEAGSTVGLRVSLPTKPDFDITIFEGAKEFPGVAQQQLLGPLSDGTMPWTGDGTGIVVARITQRGVAPTMPAPNGTRVVVLDDQGRTVADGKVFIGGLAILKGRFDNEGTHRISAFYEGPNGLPMDGETTFPVRIVGSPLTTESGRTFRFERGRWEFVKPWTTKPTARVAQTGGCASPATNAAMSRVLYMRDHLGKYAKATTTDERADWAAVFVNDILLLRKAGLLSHKVVQDFLTEMRISVPNLGESAPKPFGTLCNAAVAFEGVRELKRGVDLSGPVPVISTTLGIGLTDGTSIFNTAISVNTNVLAPPKPDGLDLTLDERATVIEALLLASGGRQHPVLRDAAAGVISTGGGNVISTGGGNIISTDGASLTVTQLRAIFAVISTGGGNVISTGGGNLTEAEKAAVQKVISTGGGNLIGQAGGNMTDNQVRALLQCISVGGGNLISDNGGGLTAVEQSALTAVISTGGGNVISTGGGNLAGEDSMRNGLAGVISTGGGNLSGKVPDIVQSVISTGGGNLAAKQVLADFVNGVISTGGGNLKDSLAKLSQVISTGGGNLANVKALIGQAGGNLISDKGLG